MKTAAAMLFLIMALSHGEDFSRHFVSATVIPIDPGLLYPDITYEYSLTQSDAIGIASGVASSTASPTPGRSVSSASQAAWEP